jgi:hypothetical protein
VGRGRAQSHGKLRACPVTFRSLAAPEGAASRGPFFGAPRGRSRGAFWGYFVAASGAAALTHFPKIFSSTRGKPFSPSRFPRANKMEKPPLCENFHEKFLEPPWP